MPSVPLFSSRLRNSTVVPAVQGITKHDLSTCADDDEIVDLVRTRTKEAYIENLWRYSQCMESLHIDDSHFEGMLSGFELEFASCVTHKVLARSLSFLFKELLPDLQWSTINHGGHYHAKVRMPGEWNIEPDASINVGSFYNTRTELITPPMSVRLSAFVLPLLFTLISVCGRTDRSCGLHFTVSHDRINSAFDSIGLLSRFNAETALDGFSRKDNSYCRSHVFNPSLVTQDFVARYVFGGIKSRGGFPYIRGDDDTYDVVNGTSRTQAINYTKLHRRCIELRAMGGRNYHTKLVLVLETALSFARAVHNSLSTDPRNRLHGIRRYMNKMSAKVPNGSPFLSSVSLASLPHSTVTVPYLEGIADSDFVLFAPIASYTHTGNPVIVVCPSSRHPVSALFGFGVHVPLRFDIGPSGQLTVSVSLRGLTSNTFTKYIRCLQWLNANISKAFLRSIVLQYDATCLQTVAYAMKASRAHRGPHNPILRSVVSNALITADYYVQSTEAFRSALGDCDTSMIPSDVARHFALFSESAVPRVMDAIKPQNLPSGIFSSMSPITAISHATLKSIVRLSCDALANGVSPLTILADALTIPGTKKVLGIDSNVLMSTKSLLRLASSAYTPIAVAIVDIFLMVTVRGSLYLPKSSCDAITAELLKLYKLGAELSMQTGLTVCTSWAVPQIIGKHINGNCARADALGSMLSVPCVNPKHTVVLTAASEILVRNLVRGNGYSMIDRSTCAVIPELAELALRRMYSADRYPDIPGMFLDYEDQLTLGLILEYLRTGDDRIYGALCIRHKGLRIETYSVIQALNYLRSTTKRRLTYYLRSHRGAEPFCNRPYIRTSLVRFGLSLTHTTSARYWSSACRSMLTSPVLTSTEFTLKGKPVPVRLIRNVLALA